ncbi:MAG: chemotaxis protein CheW [Candidatus Thermoplasmatota archaeon]|nr:chemotaxis protein CheW [Candidatus Thermoplasmatota archaeon]MBS3790281.1 chemotaxis protein CheW [Candidatus Thermoplasmatota archaeon]
MGKEEDKSSSDSLQIVVFRVGEDYLSCPIEQVREIIQLEGVTSVPSTPEKIRGIINRRGEIITVVDLPKILDLDIELNEKESQLMILFDESIGVMASEVTEIPTVSTDEIEPPSEVLESPISEKYLEGIVKHDDKLVLLTDLIAMVKNLSKEGLERAEEFSEEHSID